MIKNSYDYHQIFTNESILAIDNSLGIDMLLNK